MSPSRLPSVTLPRTQVCETELLGSGGYFSSGRVRALFPSWGTATRNKELFPYVKDLK